MSTELTDDLRALAAQAQRAAAHAYVPYSGFPVGAALRTAGGTVYTGTNVENASYGLTICAERVACTTAVAAGELDFDAVAIHVDTEYGQPCGACRQFLHEFAPDLTVVYVRDGALTARPLRELLPDGFEPTALPASPRP